MNNVAPLFPIVESEETPPSAVPETSAIEPRPQPTAVEVSDSLSDSHANSRQALKEASRQSVVENDVGAPVSPPSASAEQATAPIETPSALLHAMIGLLKALFMASIYSVRSSVRYLVHHPLHIIFDLALIAMLALGIYTGIEINNQLILDRISDKAVNEIISDSRFSHEFNSDDIDRTGVRVLIGVGAPNWIQRESVRAILYHARKAGLSAEDQAVLLAIADIESGFNPLARAPTTSACGLFQFVRRTGELFRLPVEKCMDPWENARAGVEHYINNYERKVQSTVADLSGAERVLRTFELSYYLHHDGVASTSPSNEVKAIVLSGTQFLFRAYHVLREEAQMPDRAPAFAEKFNRNCSKLADAAIDFWRNSIVHHYFFDTAPVVEEVEQQ